VELKRVEITELTGVNRNAVEGVTQTSPRELRGFDMNRAGGYYVAWAQGGTPVVTSFSGTVLQHDNYGLARYANTLLFDDTLYDLSSTSLLGKSVYLVPRVGILSHAVATQEDTYDIGAYIEDVTGNFGENYRFSSATATISGTGSFTGTYKAMALWLAPTAQGLAVYDTFHSNSIVASSDNIVTIDSGEFVPAGYGVKTYLAKDGNTFFSQYFGSASNEQPTVFSDGRGNLTAVIKSDVGSGNIETTSNAIINFCTDIGCVEPHLRRTWSRAATTPFVGPFIEDYNPLKQFSVDYDIVDDVTIDNKFFYTSASISASATTFDVTVDFDNGALFENTVAVPDQSSAFNYSATIDHDLDFLRVYDTSGSSTHLAVGLKETISVDYTSLSASLTDSFTGLSGSTLYTSVFAIDGDYAIVGFPNANSDEGKVRVYERSGGAWSAVATFSGSLGTSQLGKAVDISGDYAIALRQSTYQAEIYVRSGGSWSRQQQLTVPINFTGDCAIDGSTAAIGYYDIGGTPYSRVQIWTRSGSTWSSASTIDVDPSDDGVQGLDLDNGTLAVSQDFDAVTPKTEIWTGSGASWSLQQTVTGRGLNGIVVDGDRVAIGNNVGGAQKVRLLTRSGSTWSLEQEITVSSSAATTRYNMGLKDDYLVIGFPDYNSNQGRALVYRLVSGTWTLVDTLTGGSTGDYFGKSVEITNDFTIGVLAPAANGGNGTVYFYDVKDYSFDVERKYDWRAYFDGVEYTQQYAVYSNSEAIDYGASPPSAWSYSKRLFLNNDISASKSGTNIVFTVLNKSGGTESTDTMSGVSGTWSLPGSYETQAWSYQADYTPDVDTSVSVNFYNTKLDTDATAELNLDAEDYVSGSTLTATGTGETWTLDRDGTYKGSLELADVAAANIARIDTPSTIVYSDIGYVNFASSYNQYLQLELTTSNEITALASTPAGLLVFADNETFLVRGDPDSQDFAVQRFAGTLGCDKGVRPARLGGNVFTIWKGRLYSILLGMGDVDFGGNFSDIGAPIYDPEDPFVQVVGEPRSRQLIARTENGSVYRYSTDVGQWYNDVFDEEGSLTFLLPNADENGTRYIVGTDLKTAQNVGSDAFIEWADVDLGSKGTVKQWRRVRAYMGDSYNGSPTLAYNINGSTGTVTGSREGTGWFVFTLPSGITGEKAEYFRITMVDANFGDAFEPPVVLEFAERYRRR